MLSFKVYKTVIIFKNNSFIYIFNFNSFISFYSLSLKEESLFLWPLIDNNYLNVKTKYKQI